MTTRRSAFARARVLALCAGAALFAACASSKASAPAPFPKDADPCAAYCPVYVPPAMRTVPRLVVCREGGYRDVTTNEVRVEFDSVCVQPSCKHDVKEPDTCRRYGVVEIQPARDEWVSTTCPGTCGCGSKECFRQITVPAKFDFCEKTEHKGGLAYCYETPAEYGVVARRVDCPVTKREYCPPTFRVVHETECFMPGYWTWQKRYDCPDGNCAPDTKTCAPGRGAVRPNPRGDFRSAPPAD